MKAGERNKIILDTLDYLLLKEGSQLVELNTIIPQAEIRGLLGKPFKSRHNNGGVFTYKTPLPIMKLCEKYKIAPANLKVHLDRLENLGLIIRRNLHCVEEGIKNVKESEYIGTKKVSYTTPLGTELLKVLDKINIKNI